MIKISRQICADQQKLLNAKSDTNGDEILIQDELCNILVKNQLYSTECRDIIVDILLIFAYRHIEPMDLFLSFKNLIGQLKLCVWLFKYTYYNLDQNQQEIIYLGTLLGPLMHSKPLNSDIQIFLVESKAG